MSRPLFEEMKLLRIKEGETLIIQADRHLSEMEREFLRDQISKSGIKAVVLDGGLKVSGVQS